MERCPLCKGELEKKNITYPQSYKDRIFIMENVSAERCRQCGETFISPEVLMRVQELVWKGIPPQRKQEVPVYNLAGVR